MIWKWKKIDPWKGPFFVIKNAIPFEMQANFLFGCLLQINQQAEI